MIAALAYAAVFTALVITVPMMNAAADTPTTASESISEEYSAPVYSDPESSAHESEISNGETPGGNVSYEAVTSAYTHNIITEIYGYEI